MPAGRAIEPPGPASTEINTAISFAFCVAPLAPPPTTAGAFYPSVQLVRRYQHDLSVEHDGLQGGDRRPHRGSTGHQTKQLKWPAPLHRQRMASLSTRSTRTRSAKGQRLATGGHSLPTALDCELTGTSASGRPQEVDPAGAPVAMGGPLTKATRRARPPRRRKYPWRRRTSRRCSQHGEADFELGKALRARQGGQQGRWCLLCWFCKTSTDKQTKAAPTRAAPSAAANGQCRPGRTCCADPQANRRRD